MSVQTRALGVTLAGRHLLRDLSLVLPRGRVTALVGESGSGKSLTALAIMGLLPRGARASDAPGRLAMPWLM